jgi:ADP-heptose:LPS heptosyltransferase
MKQNAVRSDIDRVLVIALGSLGDCILSLAAMESIRNYHSAAHIVLFTQPGFKRFFNPCPFIDEVVTNWEPNGIGETLNNVGQMQSAKFDMVYDLAGNEITADIYKRFWLQKPKWSGVAPNCSHPHADRLRQKLHLLDRHAEQLWLCGIGPSEGYTTGASPLPKLSWCQEEIEKSEFGPKTIKLDFPYAIIAPEGPAEEPQKAWPIGRYIELARAVLDLGLKPIVVGGPQAFSMGNGIRGSVPEVLDLVTRLDVFGLIGIMKGAKLILGSNSDYTTIGGVLGAPVVSIINPIGANIKTLAPRGPFTVSLVARDFKDIKIDQVMAAARAVME